MVLGNHEDRIWTKSLKYALVLHPDTLKFIVSLAVEQHRTLQQGNCKNAFCQGVVPPDEITIIKPPVGDPNAKKDEYWLLNCMLYGLRCSPKLIKPPIGDPNAKKDEYWLLNCTLYGLRCSPKHWCDKIRKILNSMGLHQNAYDPCLFSGQVIDPSDPLDLPTSSHLTLGLYVDNFVYFSEDPAVEVKFEWLLKQQATVDFMGTVEWFLGTHFQWSVTPDLVQVHLSQTGFASHLVEDNNIHLHNVIPDATPYSSCLPIDACPESNEDETNPTFIERKKKYQSIVGSIGWLAQSTTLPGLHIVISTLLSMCFTTSTRPSITVLCSSRLRRLHSTPTCPSLICRTLKPPMTPSPLRPTSTIALQRIATLAGAPKLVILLVKGFNFLSSNFAV